VEALATQEYQYTGSTPADYTIEYDIGGQMVGGILTEISGGFTVFGSGFDPIRRFSPYWDSRSITPMATEP